MTRHTDPAVPQGDELDSLLARAFDDRPEGSAAGRLFDTSAGLESRLLAMHNMSADEWQRIAARVLTSLEALLVEVARVAPVVLALSVPGAAHQLLLYPPDLRHRRPDLYLYPAPVYAADLPSLQPRDGVCDCGAGRRSNIPTF